MNKTYHNKSTLSCSNKISELACCNLTLARSALSPFSYRLQNTWWYYIVTYMVWCPWREQRKSVVSRLLEVMSFCSFLNCSFLLCEVRMKICSAYIKCSRIGGCHYYYLYHCHYFHYYHNIWRTNERNLEFIWDCSIFCIFWTNTPLETQWFGVHKRKIPVVSWLDLSPKQPPEINASLVHLL